MSRIILFNKPYGVLCQFRPSPPRSTLKDFIELPDVYPAGRLDADSEGLVVLTDDGGWQHRISDPRHKLPKVYYAQVDGVPADNALRSLAHGIDLGDFTTKPARAMVVPEPSWVWPRDPPIRYRKSIPATWLEIVIAEGKNRQVRRMTAAVGHPTLRLIRYSVGTWSLDGLLPGQMREGSPPEPLNARRRKVN